MSRREGAEGVFLQLVPPNSPVIPAVLVGVAADQQPGCFHKSNRRGPWPGAGRFAFTSVGIGLLLMIVMGMGGAGALVVLDCSPTRL